MGVFARPLFSRGSLDTEQAQASWDSGAPAYGRRRHRTPTRRLTLPVLAIGGAESSGEGVGNTMKLAADDVQTLVLPGTGHWVAEQAPEQLLAALTTFLAPYRDRAAAAPNP